jgi:hypothetical protein
MRIAAQTAFLVMFVVVSASSAAAQNAKLVDQPSGDVWISEPGSQTPSRDGKAVTAPEISPSIVTPDGQTAAPEINFYITLTLRRNDRHSGHGGRIRHAMRFAHRGPRHKFRLDACPD